MFELTFDLLLINDGDHKVLPPFLLINSPQKTNQSFRHEQSFYLKKSELLYTVRKKTWDHSWNISCLFAFHVNLTQSCHKKQENPHTFREHSCTAFSRGQKKTFTSSLFPLQWYQIPNLNQLVWYLITLISNIGLMHTIHVFLYMCFPVISFYNSWFSVFCWLKTAPCWTTVETGKWLPPHMYKFRLESGKIKQPLKNLWYAALGQVILRMISESLISDITLVHSMISLAKFRKKKDMPF